MGIGDVGMFSKETKKINFSFSAYLISKRQFRNITLPVDDWQIRPLNAYLISSSARDTSELDTLVSNIFTSDYQYKNLEFKAFLQWVKTYNINHPLEMVNLFGVASSNTIPPSYFLSAYIYPVDASNGQKLSAKWSDDNTPDSLAYVDIRKWAESQKDLRISKLNQDLISRCVEDLSHNNSVLKLTPLDQKFSRDQLNGINRYVANQILKKLNKKTIFLGLNKAVVKANLESNFVIDQLQYSSIGNYLKISLAGGYKVYVTDFAVEANLPVADFSTQKMNIQNATGSDQAKGVYRGNDYVEPTEKLNLLKGYNPAYLSAFPSLDSRIIVGKDQYVFDGLFILSTLSVVSLIY
ncbi:hypothetical protein [Pedobacter sp. UYP24]